MKPLFPFLLVFGTLLSAGKSEEVGKSKHNFDSLPDGTKMHNLKVVRYDENLKPTALVKAELVDKISSELIEISGMDLIQFGKDQINSISVKLEKANYNPATNFVMSDDSVSLSAASGICNGTGMITNLNSRKGLLLGPIHSKFKFVKRSKIAKKPMKPLNKAATAAATSIALVSSGLGNQQTLSPQKIKHLDALRNSQVTKASFPEQETIASAEALDATQISESSHSHRDFLNSGQVSQFIQQKEETDQVKDAPLKAAPLQLAPVTPAGDELQLNCEGDSFFDIAKGIVSFQKNVKLREPRLSIDCSKELTLTYTPKVKAKKVDGKADEKVAGNKHGIDKIIARGSVSFQAKTKDDKGVEKTVKGFADIVEFDYAAGTTILKGSKPYIIATEGNRWIKTETLRENQWIIIKLDGSTRINGGNRVTVGGINDPQKP